MKIVFISLFAALWLAALLNESLAGESTLSCSAELKNCESCRNRGVLCAICSAEKTLNKDETGCIDCPSNCAECIAEGDNAVCTKCSGGYRLSSVDKTCIACSSGCEVCELEGSVSKCKKCYSGNVITDINTCISCGSNCLECKQLADSRIQCTKCSSDWTVARADGTCIRCPDACQTCNDPGNGSPTCTKCYTGYEKNNAEPARACLRCPAECNSCDGEEVDGHAKCTDCKQEMGNALTGGNCEECVPNCVTCKDTSSCSTCRPNFRVDDGDCKACPWMCKECEAGADGDVCKKCMAGYGSKVAISCDKCSANCDFCNQLGRCTLCSSGYVADSDGKCKKCGSNCRVCVWDSINSRTNCKSESDCEPGFTWDLLTGQCHVCPANCQVGLSFCNWVPANSRAECTVCSSAGGALRVVNTDTGGCIDCPDNCVTCEYNSTLSKTLCTDCKTDFVLRNDICEACPGGCKVCTHNETTSMKDCTSGECYSGYIYETDSPNDICRSCGTGCTSCNATNCLICDTGYALNAEMTTCSTCPPNCRTCAYDDVTLKCDSSACEERYGIIPDRTACLDCPSKCLRCTYDSGVDARLECSPNSCDARYVNDNVVGCKACPSHCKSCTYNAQTKKTSCNTASCDAGYARDADGKCPSCPSNCATCHYDTDTSKTVCDVCDARYALKTDKSCVECPAHCSKCSWMEETNRVDCDDGKCNVGYGLHNGQCEACAQCCDKCTYSTENSRFECDTCSAGCRKNEETCGACPANCAECDEDKGTMICTKCAATYALKSDDKSCVKCPSQCLECTASGSSVTCQKCVPGTGISADKTSCSVCSEIAFDNCNMCSDVMPDGKSNCTSCNSGYVLRDDKLECLDSSGITDCMHVVDRFPECTQCSSGYTLDENMICGIKCYTCGSLTDLKSEDECGVEQATGNYTEEFCATGACWLFRLEEGATTFARGCGNATGCSGNQEEFCRSRASDGKRICTRCCSSELCNEGHLDGISAGVSMLANCILLTASLAFWRLFWL